MIWATDLLKRQGSGADDVSALAYLALSLVRASRFTIDNETTSERRAFEKSSAAANSLEVAEHILGLIIDGTEELEAKLKKR